MVHRSETVIETTPVESAEMVTDSKRFDLINSILAFFIRESVITSSKDSSAICKRVRSCVRRFPVNEKSVIEALNSGSTIRKSDMAYFKREPHLPVIAISTSLYTKQVYTINNWFKSEL